MTSIHILAKHDDTYYLNNLVGDDFQITYCYKFKNNIVYIADVTEELYAFLVLKYGSHNVWKR